MQKIQWLKVVIAAILLVVVAQIVHMIGAMMTMKYYMNPALANVWSKVMMPAAGPPPVSFFYWSIGAGLITAVLFAFIYNVIKDGVPGSGIWDKGLCYGSIVFLLGTLPGMLSLYLLINLPKKLIASWTVEGLVINLVDGLIVAWLIK